MLEHLAFARIWVLAALLVLPLLWWLLRLTPPRPKRILFGAFPLLKGLVADQQITARAPIWLWVLRLGMAAIVILAASGPHWQSDQGEEGNNDGAPLILITDDDAAAAASWPWLQSQAQHVLADAALHHQPVLWLTSTTKQQGSLQLASEVAARLHDYHPKPLLADLAGLTAQLTNNMVAPDANIVWLSSGAYTDFPADLQDALENYGSLTVLTPPPAMAWIREWRNNTLTLQRLTVEGGRQGQLVWLDGQGHPLGSQNFDWQLGQASLHVQAVMPAGKQHQVHGVRLAGQNHAGAVWLMDPPGLPPVGIVGEAQSSGTPLLNPVYYLNNALRTLGQQAPIGSLTTLLGQHLPALILPDVALTAAEQKTLQEYVQQGGLLIRWLGPVSLAAAHTDHLYPLSFLPDVRQAQSLTAQGGALHAARWPAASPLQDIKLPVDLTFTQMLNLKPANDQGQIWAQLQNQMPWIAAQQMGKGKLIAVYTTATPEWSNVAITGLMPELLAGLLRQAGQTENADTPNDIQLVLRQAVNESGQLMPPATSSTITRAQNGALQITQQTLPGLYRGQNDQVFLNLGAQWQTLRVFQRWPDNTNFDYTTAPSVDQDLGIYLWLLAFLLFLLDSCLTLGMRGMLPNLFNRKNNMNAAGLVLVLLLAHPVHATEGVNLAYIRDNAADTLPAVLQIVQEALNSRTTAVLGPPTAIDPATTNLAPFPIVFWAPTHAAPLSDTAAQAIQQYLEKGGLLLLFAPDDPKILTTVTQNLRLPALQTAPASHVLWRSFYLIQPDQLPNNAQEIWLDQAAIAHSAQIAHVIILPSSLLNGFGELSDGEGESSIRLLINCMIYALTGDYKTDQVHLPYILKRINGNAEDAKFLPKNELPSLTFHKKI